MKNIMLVDDSEIGNFIVKTLIGKLNTPYAVSDFLNPEEAFASLNQVQPDLILLDLNMPQMDGWEFLSRMQAATNPTNVIILSSSTSEVDRSRSLQYGNVLEFCSKPISREKLAEILGTAVLAS